jgi:SAM-dependent methyltransferase
MELPMEIDHLLDVPPLDLASNEPLQVGDHHYRAFVGPPEKYDVMAAHQFELLYQLGLRERHVLLDIGCGSLRAGRLFVLYLEPGNYFGVEPNEWVREAGVVNNLGHELVRLRRPTFSASPDFQFADLHTTFDFALAQSIFSHAAPHQIMQCFKNLYLTIRPNGIFAATFVIGTDDYNGGEWVYPGCIKYRESTVRRFATEAGFFSARLEADHPNQQTWFVFSRDAGVTRELDGTWIGFAATTRLRRLTRSRIGRLALAAYRLMCRQRNVAVGDNASV